MPNNSVVLRFDEVVFNHADHKPILNEVSFSIRTGSRVALMGQNGAGKTSLFKLILGELTPTRGGIFITPKNATIGIAKQVIAPSHLDLTLRAWFATTFTDIPYNLDKHIGDVLQAVNLKTDLTKKVRAHSGGQQARLLLAYALMQDPDILLLDEPTNNLDQTGINHLTGFLMSYDKTVIVISHDADFLNAFTDGVLYLDMHAQKIEQYVGNYFNVVEQIASRIERERQLNARAEADVKKKIAQAEVFAHKGGKLRSVAKRMREYAADMEEGMVEVRREDKTIRNFEISTQEFAFDFNGKILEILQIGIIKQGEPVSQAVNIVLRRGSHLLLTGPNGIGKSTFLEKIVLGQAQRVTIGQDVRVGYCRQDFSTLDFKKTAYDSLEEVMEIKDEHLLRSTAAGFLLDGKILASQIKSLSEGQKGLLVFARLVLFKPGLLILDEPTNHINWRHLPVIARALKAFAGAMIIVSHIPDFVAQVRIDDTVDLDKL
ncbi:MAG: ATP-binding cassette domain-containing protein [Patescibacteria group bacterium]